MSEHSDPKAITNALAAAIDAFNEEGYGVPRREEAINSDADWKTQLTKACRLLAAVDTLSDHDFHTARIELCFGATERSVQAFAIAEGGDDIDDFHDHTTCYDRATALGLLSDTTTGNLRQLYDTNRTDSYYGGRRPQNANRIQCSNLLALSMST
ncbi:MAG: DNA-binding protein [Natrialbaceae archaeon]|nr:DNA-binding protein [Natrialbaceae archaeon]